VPTALAAKVKVPTLILAAEGTPETAQALAEAIPGARFEALKGSTYETPPAELAERVTEFLVTRA
jgi:pimeloyl-ACP methyl ester carboxylesterase